MRSATAVQSEGSAPSGSQANCCRRGPIQRRKTGGRRSREGNQAWGRGGEREWNVEAVGGEEENRVASEGRRGGGVEGEEGEDGGGERTAVEGAEVEEVGGLVAIENDQLVELLEGVD